MAKIKVAKDKPLADTLEAYRKFFLMMLAPHDNFFTHPDMEGVEIPNTLEMKQILKVIPPVHKTFTYRPLGDKGLFCMLEVTPSAKQVIDEVRDDLIQHIREAESKADKDFALPQFEHIHMRDRMGRRELALADEMEKQIREEEERAKQADDNSAGSN